MERLLLQVQHAVLNGRHGIFEPCLGVSERMENVKANKVSSLGDEIAGHDLPADTSNCRELRDQITEPKKELWQVRAANLKLRDEVFDLEENITRLGGFQD